MRASSEGSALPRNPCLACTDFKISFLKTIRSVSGCHRCLADPTEFLVLRDRRRRALIISGINKPILINSHIHILCFCLAFLKPLRLASIASVVYKLTAFSAPTLHYMEKDINPPGPQTCQLGRLDTSQVSGGFMKGKSEEEGSC